MTHEDVLRTLPHPIDAPRLRRLMTLPKHWIGQEVEIVHTVAVELHAEKLRALQRQCDGAVVDDFGDDAPRSRPHHHRTPLAESIAAHDAQLDGLVHVPLGKSGLLHAPCVHVAADDGHRLPCLPLLRAYLHPIEGARFGTVLLGHHRHKDLCPRSQTGGQREHSRQCMKSLFYHSMIHFTNFLPPWM